jgi:hypothetical protein
VLWPRGCFRRADEARGSPPPAKRKVLVALGFSDPERRSNHLGSSNSERSTHAFHGVDCTEETFRRFREWLEPRKPVVFVSDNPAYDFQWINFYFWRYFGENPFGHSGRRIADFYAGLVGDFRNTQRWKRLRRTKHDHHPVHDALGNAEALIRIFEGER